MTVTTRRTKKVTKTEVNRRLGLKATKTRPQLFQSRRMTTYQCMSTFLRHRMTNDVPRLSKTRKMEVQKRTWMQMTTLK
jgi:hypothetical protein